MSETKTHTAHPIGNKKDFSGTMKAKRPTETRYFYSPEWKGERRNFNWSTGAMAASDGCVQIHQDTQTVLLSPAQWKALVKWVSLPKKAT